MEKSFLGFTSQYPTWVPRDQSQSLFLSKMTEISPSLPPHASTSGHNNHNIGQSRFSMNHSTNNIHPITSARSISAPRSNRYNFTNPTLAEESDNNKAYQRSKFTSNGSGGGSAKSTLANKRSSGFARVEQVIDEESGLDGDSYIATTETQPFGNEDHDLEVEEGEERRGGNGLTGLLEEVYKSKKW